MKKHIALIFLIVVIWILGMLTTPLNYMHQQSMHGQKLTNWEYQWGDSPVDENGIPTWTEDQTVRGWHSIQNPSNPPGRNNQHILWLRADYPQAPLSSNSLYLQVSQLFEVYGNKEIIYRFGYFDTQGGRYQGTPPRIIHIPYALHGKKLYFRIYSDNHVIGLFNNALVGKESNFILYLFRTELFRMSLGIFYILVGFIAAYTYFRIKSQIYLFSFSVFVIFFGIYTISRMTIIYFFIDKPLLWTYAELISLYLGTTGIIAFLQHIFGSGWKKIMRRLWQIHLIYAIVSLNFNAINIVSIGNTLHVYQFLLLISMIVVIIHIAIGARKGNKEAKVILLGSIIFSLTGIIDIIVNLFFIQVDIPSFTYLGMLIFIVLMMVTLVKRLVELLSLLRNSEKLYLVGQLSAGVAHEIRNPITVISGFLQMMTKEKNHHHYLKLMLSEVNRINNIVSEFLVLSKPMILKFEQQYVHSLWDDILLLFKTQAEACQIQIHIDTEKNIPPIRCEKNQLKQVFINLLKNAMEAMESMDAVGEIRIEIKRYRNEQILITITDQGNGISQEHIHKIGSPFYTTKEKGTGLGLMVSKKIIQQHGGKLEIESRENIGTIVSIKLPTDYKHVEDSRQEVI